MHKYDIIKAAGFNDQLNETKMWFEHVARTINRGDPLSGLNTYKLEETEWIKYMLSILKGKCVLYDYVKVKIFIRRVLASYPNSEISLGRERKTIPEFARENNDLFKIIGDTTGWWTTEYPEWKYSQFWDYDSQSYVDDYIRYPTMYIKNIKTRKDYSNFKDIGAVLKPIFGKPPTIIIVIYIMKWTYPKYRRYRM